MYYLKDYSASQAGICSMELVRQDTIQICTVSQIRAYHTTYNFLAKEYSSVVNEPYYTAAYYSTLKAV